VSRPLRRCELASRQLKTVADRKFEVWTRSEQSSSSHRHSRHDTDRTVLSCLAGGVNGALLAAGGVADVVAAWRRRSGASSAAQRDKTSASPRRASSAPLLRRRQHPRGTTRTSLSPEATGLMTVTKMIFGESCENVDFRNFVRCTQEQVVRNLRETYKKLQYGYETLTKLRHAKVDFEN